jgi:hypothetical protein
MEAVLANFCVGKWVLVIDADELFVYDGFETQSISVLTEYAERHGYDSFLSPMIDMYSNEKLSEVKLGQEDIPYKICHYFDHLKTMEVQKKEKYGSFSNSSVYSSGLRG